MVEQFRLGWAPDEWDALASALGTSPKLLTDAGLGFINRRGRIQDAFRARVLFPICDSSGRPIAFGGRILPGAPGQPAAAPSEDRRPEPKYKNSMETTVYAKSRTLYALNWAKKDVIGSGEVVVCEGYTDVIGFFHAGLPRAVATCGTALGEEHFTLLRNFAKRIVLAYDADGAGQSATGRVYEWERKHDVEVAVAAFPAGSDPAELAQRDPEAVRTAIAGARPFLQFRVDRVLDAEEATTPEARARILDRALAVVAEHPDDLVRDSYLMQVADRCRFDPARTRERLAEIRRNPKAVPAPAADRSARRHQTSPPPSAPRPTRAEDRPGLEALRLAVHQPDAVIDLLDEVLFTDELQQRAFRALLSATSLQDAVDRATGDVAELLRRVTVEEPLAVENPLLDPVDAVVSQVVRRAARRALGELQAALRGGRGSLADGSVVPKLKQWLEELDEPVTCREAEGQLVAWLRAQGAPSERGGAETWAQPA